MNKKILYLVSLLLLIFVSGCSSDNESESSNNEVNEENSNTLEATSDQLMYVCDSTENQDKIYLFENKINVDISSLKLIYDGVNSYTLEDGSWVQRTVTQEEKERFSANYEVGLIDLWLDCRETALISSLFDKPQGEIVVFEETQISNEDLSPAEQELMRDFGSDFGENLTREDLIDLLGEEQYQELLQMYEGMN